MGLIIRGVCKTYGAQLALSGINLTLTGGVVALLGANGSGKSTLLRILATLVEPDGGEIIFEGWQYGRDERNLRACIGYLPQTMELPDTLTPRRLLRHLANLRGGDSVEALASLRLEGIADAPFLSLSTGQQRLVGIAQALLGTPRLLLLDELARGLDVTERGRVFRRIRASGALAIFSTHSPSDIECMEAQTVIVLDKGQVLFHGTVETMRSAAAGSVYELDVPTERLSHITQSLIVSRTVSDGSATRLRVIGASPGNSAKLVPPSLEDAYLLLTSRLS